MKNELQLARNTPSTREEEEFVTIKIAGQLFGIPVLIVQDVLRGLKITRVPLAPPEVAGALNLRGRIVTAIELRKCFDLPEPENRKLEKVMSVVVEYKNEFFSFIVDSVGDVINLPKSQIEKSPASLSGRWRDASLGIYKLENELLIILDVKKLLKF